MPAFHLRERASYNANVTYVSEERFREIFNITERFIEDRYGIPVIISDVAHPFTGDLDGAQILVDFDQSAEDALFVIAHLFGHTVQWNVSASAREVGMRAVTAPDEDVLRELREYEDEAARYTLQLFHDAGVHDLDQWVADFAACDSAYLMHFYRTGEKRAFRSFWKNGMPAIAPLAIPSFQPTKWLMRSDGIVV